MEQENVILTIDHLKLEGLFALPPSARGIVIFAHGSGSSRFSPRNNFVASVLHQHSIGTLLFDLLTQEEDQTYATRFDIELLGQRLIYATDWLKKQTTYAAMPLGYFGASTGSAAALIAAAHYGHAIKAVVSRGGRPDMAISVLDQVTAATLLIVGGADTQVIAMNQEAYDVLECKKELYIIPGATHLFEEPGALENAAEKAADWFVQWL